MEPVTAATTAAARAATEAASTTAQSGAAAAEAGGSATSSLAGAAEDLTEAVGPQVATAIEDAAEVAGSQEALHILASGASDGISNQTSELGRLAKAGKSTSEGDESWGKTELVANQDTNATLPRAGEPTRQAEATATSNTVGSPDASAGAQIPPPEAEPAPVDLKAKIAEASFQLKTLWPHLTQEQISSNPVLGPIFEDYGGDIDKFIQAQSEAHDRQGNPEHYKDSDILKQLSSAKAHAISAVGYENAAKIWKKEADRQKLIDQLEVARSTGDSTETEALEEALKNFDALYEESSTDNSESVSVETRLDNLRLEMEALKLAIIHAEENGDTSKAASARQRYAQLNSEYGSLMGGIDQETRERYEKKVAEEAAAAEERKKKKSWKKRLLEILGLGVGVVIEPIYSDLRSAAAESPQRRN